MIHRWPEAARPLHLSAELSAAIADCPVAAKPKCPAAEHAVGAEQVAAADVVEISAGQPVARRCAAVVAVPRALGVRLERSVPGVP